jgi:ABC-type multidrug transport system fused ATPase/permease subunit
VGFALGVVVVLIVAVLVITLAVLAARIGSRARAAQAALEQVRQDTSSLQGVDKLNNSAVRVLEGARTARQTLTGG